MKEENYKTELSFCDFGSFPGKIPTGPGMQRETRNQERGKVLQISNWQV